MEESPFQQMAIMFRAHDIMKRIPSQKAIDITTCLIAAYILQVETLKKEPWADKSTLEGIESIFAAHGINIKKYLER